MVTIACKEGPKLSLPFDDYTFNMIVKRGPAVSGPNKPMYVEAVDANGLVFKMNVLDASVVENDHAQFATGLLGQWRYSGTHDRLRLVKAQEVSDKATLVKFLNDKTSHESVRQRYAHVAD